MNPFEFGFNTQLNETLRKAVPDGLAEKLFQFVDALDRMGGLPDGFIPTFHLGVWTCEFKNQRPRKCPTCGQERDE